MTKNDFKRFVQELLDVDAVDTLREVEELAEHDNVAAGKMREIVALVSDLVTHFKRRSEAP